MVLLNIAGGVALILFGIRFLRKGLERLLGHGLHAWLERMAQRPTSAAAAGAVFGTVAPSSTAQTLLTLQLLNAGKLPADSMLAFLLGANAGITVTVQLIAFRVFDYYALLLVAGLLGFQFFRSENIRGAGQSLLGLGFIFLAMSIISDAARELTGNADFLTVLSLLTEHRVLLIVFAAGLTFCAQSSTATIGLALALAESGAATLPLLVPVVLGANVGIGLTSLAAGFNTPAGRRLATANLALKCAIVIAVLLAFRAMIAFVAETPGDLTRQAANFHSAFSVIAALLGVVFAAPLGRLLHRALPEFAATGLAPVTTHLDPSALATPAFALANATRETLRLADEVKTMLEGAWRALNERNAELARQVQKHDDRVDDLQTAIKQYLSQLSSEALTPRDNQLQFGLLNFATQLEGVGDIVDKSLCGVALKQAQRPVEIAAEDRADLAEFYQKVLHRFDAAISVLATRDRELAREFLKESDALKEWCIEAQKRHYQRLTNVSEPATLEASERYLDVMNSLRRISGLVNTIGHTFTLEKARRANVD